MSNNHNTVDIEISPKGTLEILSQRETAMLIAACGDKQNSKLFALFRRCALAVLNTGSETDDAEAIFGAHENFDVEIKQRTRGLKIVIRGAPATAFVDGRMIEGIRQHLFSVLRDIIYVSTENERFDFSTSVGITDAVFHILNHARVLDPGRVPNLVVCWGGHSIGRKEYDFTKDVGYHLGLRGLDVCTGCGPGAMKGPMKGAAIGHAKQHMKNPRHIGLTEPGIIAAEPPNPIVSHLVILPDIEKRLEAFVRMGHAIIVFPGGPGTAEEILYLLGILMDTANADIKLSLFLCGPASRADYFKELDTLIRMVFGEKVRHLYKIIVGDAEAAARATYAAVKKVIAARRGNGDAYYFSWLLHINEAQQHPFEVTHESIAKLVLHRDMPAHELAHNLRQVFSAIVTGNVKEQGIQRIKKYGPFEIHSEGEIMQALNNMLTGFVKQGRMKLPGAAYEPCYRVVALK